MTHNSACLAILLIQNDPAAAGRIGVALAAGDAGSFEVEWVRELSRGLERLSKKGIAAVLLDLSLPDSEGVATFDKLFAASPDIPILILAGNASEELAKEAVSRGAQDYLVAAHLDTYSLQRALRNAVERKGIEDALYVEKERAVVTLNSIGDAVLCTNISGNITYLNIVAERMTGWLRKEAIGKPLAEVFRIIDGGTRQTARDPMEMAVEQNATVGLTINCVLIRRDGYESAIEDSAAPIHDRSGRVIGAVIVFHDVSAARAMSLQMTHTAHHDVVTGLPNRLLLNDRITQSIALAHRQSRPFAVLFLDLDHFKNINDSLGHAGGDELLRSVSTRLLAGVRGSDTVSRQGGDEFAILLPEITHAEDAATCAAKILVALNAPYVIGVRTVHVGASIGISLYPRDGEDSETLIKNADMAMYHAKERGRGNFQFFEGAMNLKAVERQSVESELRRALSNQEFLLHYQPKVNLDTGDITGVEALIRWQQSDRGLVPPSEFVPIAEDCGLIVPIGRWVMREACTQARAWQDAGLPHLRMAVNVSAIEFRAKGFVEYVRKILSETGLQARYLVLELTERVLMENAESTALLLEEIKAMGVHLAVDDFGTGYSSLSYLRQFPIDVLKIDQSFIQKITSNLNDSTIIAAIIAMGRNLHHIVIAEGIETQEQIAYLQSQHCEEGQGFLLSPPVSAAEFGLLLETGIAASVVN
ncbi:MAG TPA: EAL domain-containing protein [Candidatus Binatus sp.]|jgi:diguanylate cyclase (GGDEF)-like protein/PAS domain S-box-containing protein|nr:EAL domain-containing protein [Candidatus Binatus sp.]